MVLDCIGCRLCLELFWVAVVLRGWVGVTCFFMFWCVDGGLVCWVCWLLWSLVCG